MKRIFILVLAVACAGSAWSCDICGYGVANYNPFLFPHLSRSYLGLTYQHRLYHTYADDGAVGKEHYNSILLSAQYGVTKKLQVIALLPYQLNNLRNENGTKNRSGLGDMTVLANYTLWNKPTGTFRQTVLAGAGIKLPTGKYEKAKTETPDDPLFQLGTGSTDYLLNAAYRIGYRKWILSTATSYKYNTTNSAAYRYGDLITAGATLIYRRDWDGFSAAPYVQVVNENRMQDADNHVLQHHSGGHVLYTGGGIDMNTRKIAFGVNYQWAPGQQLANGQIMVKPAFSTHISFVL